MKIIRVEANGYKRLNVIDISPDPAEHVVMVTGPNGSGKSSVLDAIWAALGGGAASKGTPQPVHDGQTTAEIRLTLDDYIVTRTFKADGSPTGSLKVTTRDGIKLGTGQSVLDGLYSKLTFDPLAFSVLAPKDQRAQLLSMVKLPYDPVALEAERADVYESRTVVGRDVEATAARLAALPEPDANAPTALASAATILAELRDVQAASAELKRLKADHEAKIKDVLKARAEVDRLAAQLAAAENALALAEADSRTAAEAVVAGPSYDPTAEQALLARLATVEDENKAFNVKVNYDNLSGDLEALRVQRQNLTDRLNEIEAEKSAALAAAAMPLPGLGFDDHGITFNSVPFGQTSAAERLRISTAMGMALNPTLRIMTINDGSLLDRSSLAIIEQLAASNDYQLWIEFVTESGDGVGVEMFDGSVAHVQSPTALASP